MFSLEGAIVGLTTCTPLRPRWAPCWEPRVHVPREALRATPAQHFLHVGEPALCSARGNLKFCFVLESFGMVFFFPNIFGVSLGGSQMWNSQMWRVSCKLIVMRMCTHTHAHARTHTLAWVCDLGSSLTVLGSLALPGDAPLSHFSTALECSPVSPWSSCPLPPAHLLSQAIVVFYVDRRLSWLLVAQAGCWSWGQPREQHHIKPPRP